MSRNAFGLCAMLVCAGNLFAQSPPRLEAVPIDRPVVVNIQKAPDPVPPPDPAPVPPPVLVLEAAPDPVPPKPVTGSFQFGLNGSSGNTNVVNIQSGLDLRRETLDNIQTLIGTFSYAREQNTTNTNNILINGRNELLLGPNNPLTIIGMMQIEYDEFRAYDFRTGFYGGIGYAFYKDEATLLKGYLGAGVAYENGTQGVASAWTPEAVFGLEFNHTFSERQKFVSGIVFFPDIADFGSYRMRLQAAYEILVDPKKKTALRIGVIDRYDSRPGDSQTRPNDLNYFASLSFKF